MEHIPRYDTRDFDPQTEIGFLRQNSVSETAPLHTHEFFEMFLVTDGKALHLVNNAVQNIEKGDLVLIRPEDCHCYDFYMSFDFRFTNVAFTVEAFSAVAELFLPDTPFDLLLASPLPPIARLTEEEWRFVLAHEYLHAALCHEARLGKRDPELWNVACDYVINQWLRDMEVGSMPEGLLFDPELQGLSAESVYDRLAVNLRKYRRMAQHDIRFGPPDWAASKDFVDLDSWCRSAIQRGLDYHQTHERGYLPEGLVEEIRALSQPPIPWDVKLARWFDQRFEPLEKRRTYARLSRRQSATPDIPRPSWHLEEKARAGRTVGVLLDTSGSMDRSLLAAALGAIASYSAARDVNRVRVVFCDAAPYDQGYMEAADIAGSVKVRGRGGTVLQPGVELLEHAPDFPRQAPLLVITDCECDRLNLYGRDHAFLVPRGRSLPFPPKGPVFYLE